MPRCPLPAGHVNQYKLELWLARSLYKLQPHLSYRANTALCIVSDYRAGESRSLHVKKFFICLLTWVISSLRRSRYLNMLKYDKANSMQGRITPYLPLHGQLNQPALNRGSKQLHRCLGAALSIWSLYMDARGTGARLDRTDASAKCQVTGTAVLILIR